MNDLTQKARERIASLKKEIEILENFISVAEYARALLEQPLPAGLDAPPGPQRSDSLGGESGVTAISHPDLILWGESAPVVAQVKTKRVTGNPKPAVVIDAAVKILRENGAPMSRRELHAALAERGIIVRGADPVKALGTMLWRGRDRIVQIDSHGYWPREDEFLEAGYLGRNHDQLEDL